MQQSRKDHRVIVNLPISCFFYERDNYHNQLMSNGSIEDISLGGMKISVPLPNQSKIRQVSQLDYQIHLPEPFQTISGQGEIRWSNIDLTQDLMQIGLAFTHIDQYNLEEITCIIEELAEHQ